MKKFALVLRDTLVFILILALTKFILSSDFRYLVNTSRDVADITAVAFMFLSVFSFIILKNRKYLVSILYAIIIFLIIVFLCDRRVLPDYWYILLGMIVVSMVFYQLKITHDENVSTRQTDKIDVKKYTLLGQFDGKIDFDRFEENREMDLDRSCYKQYKPKLLFKFINPDNDMVFNFSNKDDLNFVLVISDNNTAFVKHKKNEKYASKTNESIVKYLKSLI